jgi:hypothetical protein
MSLPDREDLASRVRRYRIEGYDLDDLVQEAYLCLLDPEGDGDVEAHLNRLRKRVYRRIVKVNRHAIQHYELTLDDTKARTSGDIDARVVMIAAESECDNDADRWLLNSLATGSSYRDFELAWNCRKLTARKRVSRFRERLYNRVYETFDY